MNEKKGFLQWVSENPITSIVILITLMGVVALIVGYKEGVMAIIGGLLNWIRGGDSESKQKYEESKRDSDMQFAYLNNIVNRAKEQQITHDKEIEYNVQSAKAECDAMDIDELVDLGNSMLRNSGIS
jgi:hypothetical protein